MARSFSFKKGWNQLRHGDVEQARNKLIRNTTYIVTISALAALIFFVGHLLQLDINI